MLIDPLDLGSEPVRRGPAQPGGAADPAHPHLRRGGGLGRGGVRRRRGVVNPTARHTISAKQAGALWLFTTLKLVKFMLPRQSSRVH